MKLTKKMIIAGAGVVGAVGIGTAAFAFFNAGGSGTGSASVSGTAGSLTLTGSATALVPEETSFVSVTATNGTTRTLSLNNAVRVIPGSVQVGPSGSLTATCPIEVGGSPYLFATPTIQPGFPVTETTTITLKLKDLGPLTDQSACLTAGITFDLTTAP